MPQLGLDFAFFVDGYGLFFASLILVIGLLIITYARWYLGREDPMGRFYAYLLLFQGAMLGIVLSDNVLVLLVFWELTSLTSFLLIGYWRHLPEGRQGARMALVVTGAGGLSLIAGMLLLGQAAGTYELSEILTRGDQVRASPLYLPILLLVLGGAFTKSAQFPFHFWLPHAMAAPTPVSAYLHSATMVKAGIFLLGRLWPVLVRHRGLVPDRHRHRPGHHGDRGLDRALQGRPQGAARLLDRQPSRPDHHAVRHGHADRRRGRRVPHPQPLHLQGRAVPVAPASSTTRPAPATRAGWAACSG